MSRSLPSEGSAPKALTRKPNAANDDLLLYALLTVRADCITLAIVGDDDLEREHGRRFRAQAAERADLYAYEVASTLGTTLTFVFAEKVRDDV